MLLVNQLPGSWTVTDGCRTAGKSIYEDFVRIEIISYNRLLKHSKYMIIKVIQNSDLDPRTIGRVLYTI
jgi:hypothetical protein